MPAVSELYRKYRKRDDFALLTLSLDRDSSLESLDDLIREHGIRYPVIWMESAERPGMPDKCDWEVSAVPTTFLIDPNGQIVTDTWINDGLFALLDDLFELEKLPPAAGITASHKFNDDGSMTIYADVYSASHAPLDVNISARMMVMEYDDEADPEHTGEPTKRVWIDLSEQSGEDYGFTAEFEMFGSMVKEIELPDVSGCEYISYSVSAMVPGTEDLGDGGYDVSDSGFVRPPKPEEE